MKRVVLLVIPALIGGVVFTSCGGKDEENISETSSITSIVASVENGSVFDPKIDDVVAFLYELNEEFRLKTDEEFRLKTVKYVSGEFSIVFPETVNDRYLKNIDGGYPALKFSNKNVKGISIYIDAYQSGACVGNFYHAKNSDLQTEALFVYVDGNVNITGSDSYTNINRDQYGNVLGEHTSNTSYNVSLKKGWNIMYFTETHTRSGQKTTTSETVTTKVPDGMKWYFNGPGERTFQPKTMGLIFPPAFQKLIRVTYTF